MTRSTPLDINWEPDRSSGEPITEQIVGFMCARISSGDWPIGSRLPSQRVLAERFGVNRSTIIAAIGELADYGIVEGRHGAGTRIASNTWSLMLPGAPDWADYVSSGFFKANNDTIQTINRLEFDRSKTRLGTGELDPRLFPRDMWRRVAGEAAAEISSLGYPPPEGLDVLREAIAAHMEAWGISCTPGAGPCIIRRIAGVADDFGESAVGRIHGLCGGAELHQVAAGVPISRHETRRRTDGRAWP